MCTGCGQRAPLRRERCDRCPLRAAVEELADTGDPAAVAALLAPFLEWMATARNPASMLRWMQTPTFWVTRDLINGRIEVSHASLDAARTSCQSRSLRSRSLRCQRVADGEQDGWLLPGRGPGTHITAEHLRKRLAVHGITSRPGRHGALLALAGRLPAPILAERLGIHQARAAQWARAAGATYSGYVELRA